MNRKVGYVIGIICCMCLVCSCKKKVTNEFVDNIRSSMDSQLESEDDEVIGRITKIDGMTITVSLMEREEMEPSGKETGSVAKPNEKPSSAPEVTSTYKIESSSLREPVMSGSPIPKQTGNPEGMKPQGELKEIGSKLEITFDNDTKIVKNDESITANDLKTGNIIYIEMQGRQIIKIRVSNRMDAKEESEKSSTTSSPDLE